MSVIIRKADEKDESRLKAFAAKTNVSIQSGDFDDYSLMENEENHLMAMAGMETTGKLAVLRSLVIDPDICDLNDFILFFEALVADAEKSGYEGAVFVTPSPELFETLGFEKIMNEGIPDSLKARAEEKATVMVKKF